MSIINNVQHPPPVDQTWSTDRGIKVHDQHTNLTQSEYNSSSIYNILVQFIHSSTSQSVQGSCSSRAYAANLSLASVAADRRGLPWVGASAPAPPCSGSGVFRAGLRNRVDLHTLVLLYRSVCHLDWIQALQWSPQSALTSTGGDVENCTSGVSVSPSDEAADPGKLPECTRMVFILHKDNVSYRGRNCILLSPMMTMSLTKL